jgi:hypothetical protein
LIETVSQSVRFSIRLEQASSHLRATIYEFMSGPGGTMTCRKPVTRRKSCASGWSSTRGYVFVSHCGSWETRKGGLTGEQVRFPSFIHHAEVKGAPLMGTRRDFGCIPHHELDGAPRPDCSFRGNYNLRRDNCEIDAFDSGAVNVGCVR